MMLNGEQSTFMSVFHNFEIIQDILNVVLQEKNSFKVIINAIAKY